MRTVANHKMFIKPVNPTGLFFEWLAYSSLTGKYVPKRATPPVVTHKHRRSISINLS